jgi:hypothetical protein
MRDGKYRTVADADVEWYAGAGRYSHPVRIRLDGVWEEVFSWEKAIHEDNDTGQRTTVFLCHIGDNRIIKVTAK